MIVDVVMSNQRRYDKIVVPILRRWEAEIEQQGGDKSLRWLADHPLTSPTYPLRRRESHTVTEVAEGLLRFGDKHGLDEEGACTRWAQTTAGLELASKLDPYVGSATGIGPVLFAYLRMLCGADTVKPDVRVLAELRALGLALPRGDTAAGFVAAACLAHELGILVIELDQLLWYAQDNR